ncbi:hypothetical protein ELBI_83 [Anabaena phage Elbi]|nr:hypothetical protein ELBI_83 [Anabaena phage Elbi]
MNKTPRQSAIDELRYGKRDNPDYIDLCYRTHKASGNRCVVCTKKSKEIHHAYYCGVKKDTPGVNVFAVCQHCHDSYCHASNRWIQNYDNPMLNRNDETTLLELRQRFIFVSSLFNGIKGVMSYYGQPKSFGRTRKAKKTQRRVK